MELTTRCPQCETVFAVTLDQLQLRKGYIRCIQCASIFDGFDAVVPVPSPPKTSVAPPTAARPVEPVARTVEPVEPTLPPYVDEKPPVVEPKIVQPPQVAEPTIPPQTDDEPPRQAGASEKPSYGVFTISTPKDLDASGPTPARPFTISTRPAPTSTPSSLREPTVVPQETEDDTLPAVFASRASRADTGPREPAIPSVVRRRGEMGASPPSVPPPFTMSEPPRGRVKERRSEPVFQTAKPDHIRTTPIPDTEPIVAKDDGRIDDDFLFVEPRSGARTSRRGAEIFDGARPARRWMAPIWAVLILCGLVLLIAQGIYVYRAQLANTFPGLRPSLEAACVPVGCSVPYERRIHAIAITGSALRSSGAPEGDVSTLVLEVTLRNTYERPQEWPTLVLDLKDASGAVVVRRNLPPPVWVPTDLRDGPFAAGSELVVQLPVSVRGLQANGYQIDKFFP